jgi:hypothetical protein
MICGEKSPGFIGGKTFAWPALCGTSVPVVVAVSAAIVTSTCFDGNFQVKERECAIGTPAPDRRT